jgi:ATP/maltotriose-dependent transcriptional regulator MalT
VRVRKKVALKLSAHSPRGFNKRQTRNEVSPDRAVGLDNGTGPHALIVRSWAAVQTMQTDEILMAVGQLSLAITDSEDIPDKLRNEIDLLKAISALLEDHVELSLRMAIEIQDRIGGHHRYPALSVLLRMACFGVRDFPRLRTIAYEASHIPAGHAQLVATVMNLSIDAAVEMEQLRLALAQRLARAARDIAATGHGLADTAASYSNTLMAEMHYEAGDLDSAEELVRNRLPWIGKSGSIEDVIRAYLVSARIARARGNSGFSQILLRRAELIGERRAWPRLAAMSLSEQVSVFIRSRRLIEAQECVQRLQELCDHAPDSSCFHMLWRQLRLSQAQLKLAIVYDKTSLEMLNTLRFEAQARQDLFSVVRLTIWMAEGLAFWGEEELASHELQNALRQGATAGLYRTFLDAGNPVRLLLRRLCAQSIPLDRSLGDLHVYARTLLGGTLSAAASRKGRRGARNSGESLSLRECNVLRFMSRGLSNKHIAMQLKIAPETVKSHAKRIFIKLAAKTRAEAVSRATGLGII